MLGIGLSASARAAAFPPLNSPATEEHHSGKFVWADLFTTDPAAATNFYCGLFGWTADTITPNGKGYTVFSNGSRPVAGLQFGLGSCLTDGYVRPGVYYGPQRDPWFSDDPWIDGARWYGGPRGDANIGIYLHPPRYWR
jgi:hypothetical protein